MFSAEPRRFASAPRARLRAIAAISLLAALPACEMMPMMPMERDELRREVTDLEAQLADAQRQAEAERKQLLDKHEAEIAVERERYLLLEARLIELKGFNEMRASGIQQSFFGGDIIFVVAPEGYSDYRAALRYRSLSRKEFEESFSRYEKRVGGDAEVLRVLQEMDFNQDQLITRQEAQAFKIKEEKNYRPSAAKKN
jgi:hypothetical protein